MAEKIIVEVTVHASLSKVWEYWTQPEHVTHWNFASDDWQSPRGTNDLKVGGTFTYRMEAKDGSFGFDFGGTYTAVSPEQRIAYTMDDGRTVDITFTAEGEQVRVVEMFDAESANPIEMQRSGWQSILNNFKKYAEAQ